MNPLMSLETKCTNVAGSPDEACSHGAFVETTLQFRGFNNTSWHFFEQLSDNHNHLIFAI